MQIYDNYNKTHVKLADDPRVASECECPSNFCNSSERMFDWCCIGIDLAMLSTADVNFSSRVCWALYHNMHQTSLTGRITNSVKAMKVIQSITITTL